MTKALAAQIDKNAKQQKEYNDLAEKYSAEVKKNSDLEKELEAIHVERDTLQATLDEYVNNTHDGTVLSTDTKYIAIGNTMDNISFTEEQLNGAINELMNKDSVSLSSVNINDLKSVDPDLEYKVK